MSATAPALNFTGERFTPECVREIWYEHMHRYAFAQSFVRGRRVLDAACGEGYGSALLAVDAAHVVGVDISTEAIAHARARYGANNNTEFYCDDVTHLDAFCDASFDVIVSFETLEHVHAQAQMLAGFKRLLKPDGVLLISSPDKRNYSDLTGYRNEHHVRELYRDELEILLRSQFGGVRLLAQKLLFQSVLWDPDTSEGQVSASTLSLQGELQSRLDYAPLYYLAICTQRAEQLPIAAGAVHLFGDSAESVYSHYNDEIRRHIAAGHRLMALDQENAELRAQLEQTRAQLVDSQNQGRNP